MKEISELTDREIAEETLTHLRTIKSAIENFDVDKLVASLGPMGAIFGSLTK